MEAGMCLEIIPKEIKMASDWIQRARDAHERVKPLLSSNARVAVGFQTVAHGLEEEMRKTRDEDEKKEIHNIILELEDLASNFCDLDLSYQSVMEMSCPYTGQTLLLHDVEYDELITRLRKDLSNAVLEDDSIGASKFSDKLSSMLRLREEMFVGYPGERKHSWPKI